MSLLDEYKNLVGEETDNEFPEHMEHEGLTESDREMYETVLSQMRSQMEQANEDMRKNAKSWGDVCEVEGTGITNKTYKMNGEMLMNKLNEQSLQHAASKSEGGRMHGVSEPMGLFVEGFRCPKCGRLMFEEENIFVCPACSYKEESEGKHMQFYFVDNTYTKTPFPTEINNTFVQMFTKGNKQSKNR